MIGFVNIVNGFSLSAIQALQATANTIYIDGGAFTPITLPEVAFDVSSTTQMSALGHTALAGDGVTDDSAALTAIAADTNITNWYFPTGKSFLLYDVRMKSHLKAIYGEGTIISKAVVPTGADTSPHGAFYGNDITLTDFVLDGLTFVQENGTWPANNDTTRWYGHFNMTSHANMLNCQIRNCGFDTQYFHNNSVQIMPGAGATQNGVGGDGSLVSNVRIYDNVFTNSHEFAIEILNRDVEDKVGLNRSAINIHIHDNHFSGSNSRAISFVNVRGGIGLTGVPDGTESTIYNNIFDGCWWFIEMMGSGIRTYNNYGTGCGLNPISAGGEQSGVAIGKSFVYNNHFEANLNGSYMHIYNGSKDEYYNNYIKCRLYLQTLAGSETNPWELYFHDNTVISDYTVAQQAVIQLKGGTDGGVFDSNEIYGNSNVPRGFHIADAASGGTNVIFTNNDQYLVQSGGTCIDDSANPVTESGNTCTTSYGGSFPTSRDGAGLLP